MMKAFGWNDIGVGGVRDAYFDGLKRALLAHDIELEYHRDYTKFTEELNDRLSRGECDLIITDLVDETNTERGQDDRSGIQVAQQVTALTQPDPVPVVIITWYSEKIDPAARGLGRNVLFKSKKLLPGWMAGEIKQDLSDRGYFLDRSRVFLIFAHNPAALAMKGKVRAFLEAQDLTVDELTPGDAVQNIQVELIDRMRECGAVIALYTPDDELANGKFHTRPNVSIELGIAMGLAQGLHRTIVLRDRKAEWPSDFGGHMPLQYDSDVSEKFTALEQKLRKLRMIR